MLMNGQISFQDSLGSITCKQIYQNKMKSVKFGFNTIKLHINIKIFCFILQGLFELINYLVFKLSILSIFYSIKVKLKSSNGVSVHDC